MYISEKEKKNKQVTFNAYRNGKKKFINKGHAANADTTWAITLGTRSLHLDCTEQSEIYKLKLNHRELVRDDPKQSVVRRRLGSGPSLSLSPQMSH